MAGRKKKSILPPKSRQIIGDRLLDVIFILICFGIFWLVTGAVLGLEPGESRPVQYMVAGAGATMPIAGRLIQHAKALTNRIVIGVIWLAAAIGAVVIFCTFTNLF